jgi:hypothetical protein
VNTEPKTTTAEAVAIVQQTTLAFGWSNKEKLRKTSG